MRGRLATAPASRPLLVSLCRCPFACVHVCTGCQLGGVGRARGSSIGEQFVGTSGPCVPTRAVQMLAMCMRASHLPLATCHLPLAICHLPCSDVAGAGISLSGIGFGYSPNGTAPCDASGTCAVNLACDLFVRTGGRAHVVVAALVVV